MFSKDELLVIEDALNIADEHYKKLKKNIIRGFGERLIQLIKLRNFFYKEFL